MENGEGILKMQISERKISELKPYANNPRKNDSAVEYVANSIKEFGFKVPIIIDVDGVIVTGHTRYKAAKKLGMETVPCILADDLTEEQVKAFRLADNKVAEIADWDFELLDDELSQVLDIDMEEFGFEFDTLDDVSMGFGVKGSMQEKYLVPPFSVIYGNKHEWLERKRNWINFGIRSELGRGGNLLSKAGATQRQTSYAGGGIKQSHNESQALSTNTIARFKEMRKG